MRCALSFDEDKSLIDQKVAAWGVMQSLKEEPAYKEEDIKSREEAEFFRGYKFAIDEVCNNLDTMVEEGDLAENTSEHLQACFAGSIVELLFSILDNELEDEEKANVSE